MMSPEEIMSQASHPGPADPQTNRRKKYMIYGGIAAVILISIISISVVVSGNKKEDSVMVDLRSMISSTLSKEGIDTSGLSNGNTAQGKAMNWIYSQNDLATMDRSQILQRYALATFYYSTYQVQTLYTPSPPKWTSSILWLSAVNECEWEGVQCTDRLKVNGISLENNSLTGKVPGDLVLLRDHLVSFDLTTNLLYMTDVDFVFLGSLTKLETILMDDNYLTTDAGLPASLGACTDLKKLRLSYNLFGGSLSDDLFQKLTKLTHLEMESNFLEGDMPESIGDLSNLVYLYMRRNSMTFKLDFLKSGNMESLCKLITYCMHDGSVVRL